MAQLKLTKRQSQAVALVEMPSSAVVAGRSAACARDALLLLMFAPLRDRAGTVVGILHTGSELEPGEHT